MNHELRRSLPRIRGKLLWVAAVLAVGGSAASVARAQSSSLYGRPARNRMLTLQNSSRTHVELQVPGEEIELHDVITVIVSEASQYTSESEVNRRMQSSIDARLRDWIRLDGINIGPAAQPNGDPRARGSVDGQLRSETELESSDALQFKIAAEVVDIRPNGLLVIEARKRVRNNEEVIEEYLTGLVRRRDVSPDNTVLSHRIAELDVNRREKGHVRDGSRRGWLLRIMDYLKPI